jgi:arginyl-tRNA synthetase
MKQHIQQLITTAIQQLQATAKLTPDLATNIHIERTKDAKHGDYACNIALMLAKKANLPPRELAQLITTQLQPSENITKVEIAGPGFINFFISDSSQQNIVAQILQQQDKFGLTNLGQGKKVHIEFVSANPTGPLHVGHGRGAAYGSSVANLLAAVGYNVHREYYVNDAGRQMDILATSIWLRYLEACGEQFTFPSNGYQGEYVYNIASVLKAKYTDELQIPATELFAGVPPETGDDKTKEIHIDALINQAKTLLGNDYQKVHDLGTKMILNDIRDDLAEFGTTYDEWFSEKSLIQSGAMQKSITTLKKDNYIFEKEGALWFRSTKFGDEKDRVLIRKNGQSTYFASDIAYHWNKLKRGAQIIIDVLGADHHGYVARVRAAMQALGLDHNALHVPLVQFAILYRHGKKVQMSTRSGQFVTLRELRDEVGNDAARFFYVMRKAEQHMDFDLDLAKSQSNENPVYYIQYAYARICSIFRQLNEKKLAFDQTLGLQSLVLLNTNHEKTLLTTLSRYPEIISKAANNLEPHLLANYLRELANVFHIYYNAQKCIVDDVALRNARLCLIAASKQIIANGLGLLGVSTPEIM